MKAKAKAKAKGPVSERRLKSAAPVTSVGSAWFSSAFEVAVGDSISEALQRFSDELSATLDAPANNHVDADECLELVRRIQMRMSVAAEWAERIEGTKSEAAE